MNERQQPIATAISWTLSAGVLDAPGAKCEIAVVLEDSTRLWLATVLRRKLSAEALVKELNRACSRFGKPTSITVDHAPLFTSLGFLGWAMEAAIEIRHMAPSHILAGGVAQRILGSTQTVLKACAPGAKVSELQRGVALLRGVVNKRLHEKRIAAGKAPARPAQKYPETNGQARYE